MLYYKNSDGKYLPVDVSFFNKDKLQDSFIIVTVGNKSFQPTNEDQQNLVEKFNNFFKEMDIDPHGIFLHDKISIELLDKKQFKDKVILVRVGDKDNWKPSEAYLKDVKKQFRDAFLDADINDVVVLDVLADISEQ